ncbi:MAG: SH3 domain-containing protein [Synergistaceae bacterium]|nr:SH3 domain-containing protein [Synergistaceae bacterium]
MTDILVRIMQWPLAARVALLLLVVWFIWLVFGKLLIRVLSIVPFCIQYIMLALYILLDFPLSMLHHKFAGLFANIDISWTGIMRNAYAVTNSWYNNWKRPKKRYSAVMLLLLGIVFMWTVLPSAIGLEGAIIHGPRNSYIQVEQWLVGALSDSQVLFSDFSDTLTPLGAPDTLAPTTTPSSAPPATPRQTPSPTPTPTPEFIVSGLRTRLIVRDEPSVSSGKTLAYLVNGDVVYDLGETEWGDVENGKSESWQKIETADGIVGWVRDNYLTAINNE